MQAGNTGREGCIYRVLLVPNAHTYLCEGPVLAPPLSLPPPPHSLSLILFLCSRHSSRQKERDVIYIFMYR